jgi:hypothetical protein
MTVCTQRINSEKPKPGDRIMSALRSYKVSLSGKTAEVADAAILPPST